MSNAPRGRTWPVAELIPRSGRGTRADKEAGNTQPFDAEYGAPTSGGPPYRVYEIRPSRAFALPANNEFAPTRWRFPGSGG